jgi:hypothetical protein
MKKTFVATGLGIGLLAGTGAGLAWQSAFSAGAATDTTVQVDDTTVDPTTARQPGDRIREVLAPLVTDGTLTEAQLDAVVDALVAARPEGIGGHGHGRHHHLGQNLDLVADTIGIERSVLVDAVRDGQTIADVAAANGSSGQAVIDALVLQATTHLNTRVADGDITQAQADTRLAEITERITTFVNETPSFADRRGRGHGSGED